MKLPMYSKVTRGDYPELEDWQARLVEWQDRQTELLTTLAHGNITFGDNHLAEVRTLEIPQDTVVPIELQRLKRSPAGVMVLASSFFEYYRLAWRMSETSPLTVDVKIEWDTAPPAVPEVTLVFFGG